MREPPLRDEVLASISGGDRAFEADLLATFLRITDADAARLEAAIRERAGDRVEAIGHLVQGRCKTIGALTLAYAAEQLEHAALRGDWRGVGEAHERVREELATLRHEIARRMP